MESKISTITKYESELFSETSEPSTEIYRELSFTYWHEALDVRDDILIDLDKQIQGGI